MKDGNTTTSEQKRPKRVPKESLTDWSAKNNPGLLEEWDYSKNEVLPNEIGRGSHLKVWWIGKCGHEWQAVVNDRVSKNSGCPVCYGHNLVRGINDLQKVNPDLASEWHFQRNAPLIASDVLVNSSKKVWWIGKCGHEWQAVIAKRNKGANCPICERKTLVVGVNDLKTLNPKLASEWHPTKNGESKPEMFTRGSNFKAWWIGECGHEWQAPINNRNKGATCPFCAHKRLLPGFNDLATLRPELAAEWDYRKNGELKPTDISPGSQKKVWWICPRGHEWQAMVYTRRDGNGCPVCSSEERTSLNEKAIAFYLQKKTTVIESYRCDFLGKKELDIYLPDYKMGIEYDGDHFHKDVHRDLQKKELCRNNGIRLINIREPNCPLLDDPDIVIMKGKDEKSLSLAIKDLFEILPDSLLKQIEVDVTKDRSKIYELHIKGEKKNSLQFSNPELAKEWHPTKNGSLTPSMFFRSSSRNVWWKCDKGHEWQSKICYRANGNNCPYCSNKKVLPGYNDISSTNPSLASEWHPTKNGNLTSEMFVEGSSKIVWWKGKCGHEWQASICHRHANEKCPYCTGRSILVGFNDLESKRPDLVGEWHPTKNVNLSPKDVTEFSSKKVWWKCDKGHEWQTSVSQRTTGHGCPYCCGKYVITGENDLQTLNSALASEWNYAKNGELTPSMVNPGTEKKVWWKCDKGHEWQAAVKNRSRGAGCPICYKNQRISHKKD